MACVGNGVGCVAGEAGAGAVVGGAAVVANEGPDVGSNRAAAASAGDSVLVSEVLTGSEGRCWNACNRFGDVAVVKAAPPVGGSSGSATSMSYVDAALGKTGERPGAWPERVVAAVAGVGRLSRDWWPGPTMGWAMPL